MSKTLLLLSNRPDDQEFASLIAQDAGLKLNIAPDAAAAAKCMNEDDPVAVLVDGSSAELHQSFETAVQDTIGLFSDKVKPNAIHFLSDSEINEALFLINSPILGSFLTRDPEATQENAHHYARLIQLGLKDKAFGLGNFFGEKVKVQRLQLTKSTQKPEALEAIRIYLTQCKFQPRIVSQMLTAIDELLMNAMYDAPIDAFGKPIYASTPRSTPIDLKDNATVDLDIAFDGNYLGVTVSDHFGSLDKAQLMTFISKKFGEKEYKPRANVAGAGLGLSIVHQVGGSLSFVSESRARTEVSVFFKKVDSYKKFRKQFRFISTQFYF